MDNIDFQKPFWIADWHVDPAACRIKRADEEVKLEPKMMTVLICLAEYAGEVLVREKLEKMAWQDTVVGYDSLAGSIIKLRKAFGDDAKKPKFIETVPKRGYRFIAKISQHEISHNQSEQLSQSSTVTNTPDSSKPDSTNTNGLLRKKVYVASAIIFLLVIFSLLFNFDVVNKNVEKSKPSIAILPFKNLSNNVEQDYFSDGMTGDLITDLSKVSSLNVISRNSVFAYKNIDVDVRKLHEELGVTYVVEGSVRKVGDTVRISARLIDAKNGYNLWADRFDGTLGDIFKLQDRVSNKIVSSLAITLTENQRNSLTHEYTKSVAAYDEFLQGWQLFWVLSKDTNYLAREHFLKAIELDKDFARAYANLAYTYVYEHINGWSNDQASMEQARFYATRGLKLDPSLPQVHWVMSLVHLFSKKYQLALKSTEQNLILDPNNADGYGMMSTILNYAGKPKKALEVMKKAMALNPYYPQLYLIIRGEINFNLHKYKNAIQDFELALNRNPEAQEARLWLAAAYAHYGDIDSANWQLENIQHDGIKLSLDYFENVVPMNDPVQRNHFLDALKKAGLEIN